MVPGLPIPELKSLYFNLIIVTIFNVNRYILDVLILSLYLLCFTVFLKNRVVQHD
jgi:hypothetical protein